MGDARAEQSSAAPHAREIVTKETICIRFPSVR